MLHTSYKTETSSGYSKESTKVAWAWAPTPFVEARGKFVTSEDSFVHGTGSMRRRGRSFSLSNDKKQAHPSYHTAQPARATHRSARIELVVQHPVLRFPSKPGIPLPKLYPLWHDLRTKTRSTCVFYSGGPSKALPSRRSRTYDSSLRLPQGSCACAWRERVYVSGSA